MPEFAQLSEDASSKSYRCRQKAANELADYLEGYAEASAVNSGEAGGDPGVQNGEDEGDAGADEEEEDRPLSDTLVRDLPAHRTLGVKVGLLVQPDVAIIAVATGLRRTRLLDAIRRDLRSSGRCRISPASPVGADFELSGERALGDLAVDRGSGQPGPRKSGPQADDGLL